MRSIAVLACLAAFVCACRDTPIPDSQPGRAFPPTSEVLDILRARVDAGLAKGIAVGLLEADGSTRSLVYGDAGEGRTLDANTLFEIGSITKVFTSTLLAQMAGEGLLDIEDPVQEHLPPGIVVPSRPGQAIRFVDIAMHRSGLPSFPDDVDFTDVYGYSVEQMYAFLASYRLTRDVGAEAEYSNLAVGLMGHTLALQETDGDFEALLRRRILDPLGMSSTVIDLTPDLQARMAVGYGLEGEPAQPFGGDGRGAFAPAGGLRSSVSDLLRFLDANVGEPTTELERAMRVAHERRGPLYESASVDVGLNWYISHFPSGRIVWHSGGTFGFRTFLGFDPDKGVGAVVLTNSTTPMEDIGLHLVNPDARLATLPGDRTEFSVDPAKLERYAGTYMLMGMPLVVTAGGDGLELEGLWIRPLRLHAASDAVFYSDVMPDEYEFVEDAEGAVRMIFRGQGLEFVTERAPDGAAPR